MAAPNLTVFVVFEFFPGGASGKEPTYQCNVKKVDLIPGLGRPLGGGHSNLLQYSCLENPMDRGAWQAIQSMGLQESDTLHHHYEILYTP